MRALSGVWILLVTILLMGCSDDATDPSAPVLRCTEIGCSDGLTVVVRSTTDRFLPGHYDVSVAPMGAPARSCQFVISNDLGRCASGHCVLEENCNAIYLVGYNDPDRVSITYPVIEAPFDLQVQRDGTLLVQVNVEPVYDAIQPNGSGCPPICHAASVGVSVPGAPNSTAVGGAAQ